MSTNTIQYKTNGVFYNNEKLLTQADSSNLSVTTVSPIAPFNPISGSMWLDTTNSTSPILNVYNGAEWKQASSPGTTRIQFTQALRPMQLQLRFLLEALLIIDILFQITPPSLLNTLFQLEIYQMVMPVVTK